MIKEKVMSMLVWLRNKLFGDPSTNQKEPAAAVEVVVPKPVEIVVPTPAPAPAPEPVDPQITDSITAGRPPKRKYTKKTTTAKKVRK